MPLFAKTDRPLKVDIPGPAQDRALSSKVGIVAAVGFALGVAWPRLLGIEVGPDVPGGGPSERAAETTAQKPRAADAAPLIASADATDDAAGPGPSNKQSVHVGDGVVRSCRGKKGDKVEACGKISVDKLLKPRLAGLSSCPSALGLDGKLSLGVVLDFEKSDVALVEDQKSSLPSSTVRGVLACAAAELKDFELDKVVHTHAKYTVAYEISFAPPGRSADPEVAVAEAGLGSATVTSEKALVRESPKDGKIVARLPQGTRVKLLEEKDSWFLVESGKSKGWVYRQAIGK